MDMPALGTLVGLRGREGIVSSAGFGDAKRVGDKLLGAGAWIKVTLSDGKGPSDIIRLDEGQLCELEILGR